MSDGTFEKVSHSDNPLYGPARLLLCGFPAPAQSKFRIVLEMTGLDRVPVVWANSGHQEMALADLVALPEESGADIDSDLPRAIIVSGISENQLHALMTICRKSGMQPALWAVLTPTSETWPLRQLLAELQVERDALAKQRKP